MSSRRSPLAFRGELLAIPPSERDAWLDAVLGIDDVPDDGPALPRDGVAYLPAPLDVVVRLLDAIAPGPGEVFVDVGSGVGRVAMLVHLLTGARCVGLEIQPQLVARARSRADALGLSAAVSFVEGDALRLADQVAGARLCFLYCPFSGDAVTRWLDAVAPRPPRALAFVDMVVPPRAWFRERKALSPNLEVVSVEPPLPPGREGER